MRVATSAEAQFTAPSKRYEVAPWAAAKPGSMFDRPEDILYSDYRGGETSVIEWAKTNDVSYDPFYYSKKWTTDHYAGISGYVIQIQQHTGKMCFYRDCANFDEINRQLDIMLPLMIPMAIRLSERVGQKNLDHTIMARLFQVFEPDLCGPTIWYVLESDGEWLLVDLDRIVQRFESREAMLVECKQRFYWTGVSETDRTRDDEDTW